MKKKGTHFDLAIALQIALYDLKKDRTELNDLASQFPEKVESMSKEWFRMAKDVERLKGKQLMHVKNSLKDISFRRDTTSGSAK